YSIRPPIADLPNHEPYEPFEGAIVPYLHARSKNHTRVDRFENFVQWSYKTDLGTNKAWFNAGVRSHTWVISSDQIESKTHTVVSPRAQFALKPDWDADMVFRISGGVYDQPPFYKELRDSTGIVRPNVEAQKSIHLVLG